MDVSLQRSSTREYEVPSPLCQSILKCQLGDVDGDERRVSLYSMEMNFWLSVRKIIIMQKTSHVSHRWNRIELECFICSLKSFQSTEIMKAVTQLMEKLKLPFLVGILVEEQIIG